MRAAHKRDLSKLSQPVSLTYSFNYLVHIRFSSSHSLFSIIFRLHYLLIWFHGENDIFRVCYVAWVCSEGVGVPLQIQDIFGKNLTIARNSAYSI